MRFSPPTSALARATAPEPHPDAGLTLTDRLLQAIEYDLQVLRWHNTIDGQKGKNPPQRLAITKAERDADALAAALRADAGPDVVDIEELRRRLRRRNGKRRAG